MKDLKFRDKKNVSEHMSHSLFISNLREDNFNVEKRHPLTVNAVEVRSHIDPSKNEVFKKTNIFDDDYSKVQKPITKKLYSKQDNLKQMKPQIDKGIRNNIKLQSEIVKENNFPPKKLDEYEKFYNEKPSTNISESRKYKVKSLLDHDSMLNSQTVTHGNSAGWSEFKYGHKASFDFNIVSSRKIGPPNDFKITNQDCNMIKSSVTEHVANDKFVPRQGFQKRFSDSNQAKVGFYFQ